MDESHHASQAHEPLAGLLLLLGGLGSIAVSIFSRNPDETALGRLLDDD